MNVEAAALEPVVDSTRMKDVLRETVDKRGKIARMIASGELIQLRRGLYATRRGLNPLALAGPIYGPSYISFESALSWHGLIPEAVYEITSATLRRPREIENSIGRFRYRRIPEPAYPIGVDWIRDAEVPFLLACPTKAICDRIALEPRMRSLRDVLRWAVLMRFASEVELDMDVLRECAERYRRPSVRLLLAVAERRGGLAL